MNHLNQQLQRLYFLPAPLSGAVSGREASDFDLIDTDGRVRCLLVDFTKAADWVHVARLYRGIQEDLELPAPAISVSAQAGYRLWLSLAEPVALAEALGFLEALRQRYLADLPPASLVLLPQTGAALAGLVPSCDEKTGKWSAFIDPSMGSLFVDEPGLEMAPGLDRQADMLAGLASVALEDFRRVLGLGAVVEQEASEMVVASVGPHYTDPHSFLLAVMNDASARMEYRIEAAKALLPYGTLLGQEAP